jgi:hypothetical protein
VLYQLFLDDRFIGVFVGDNEKSALDAFSMANGYHNIEEMREAQPRYRDSVTRLQPLVDLDTLDKQETGIYVEFARIGNINLTRVYVGPFREVSHAQVFISRLPGSTQAFVVHHKRESR